MMRELIKEYRAALRVVNRVRNLSITPDEDKKTLSGCADSLLFSIEYMEKGREPGNRNGINRMSYRRREIPVDPQNVDLLRLSVVQKRTRDGLSIGQRELLDCLLGKLTDKEREAYVIVRGSGYSFSQAADLLGVTKGTVQTLVARAQEKFSFVIRKRLNSERIFGQAAAEGAVLSRR